MKTLKYILAVLAVAISVAMPQTWPTKSEIDDARDSGKAFEDIMTKFHKAYDWTPLLDELENAAKQYVGKSKIQVAMLDVEFRNAPAELKTKAALVCVKLDDATAQAIRFTQAYRKALTVATSVEPKDDAEHAVAYADQAEIERQKYFAATKEWAAAAQAFVAAAKK
jgi:sulfur relay (sulfurtransferase) DsrC/TusE family protein